MNGKIIINKPKVCICVIKLDGKLKQLNVLTGSDEFTTDLPQKKSKNYIIRSGCHIAIQILIYLCSSVFSGHPVVSKASLIHLFK